MIGLAGALAGIHDRTRPTQHPIGSAQYSAVHDRVERGCTEDEKALTHVEGGKAMAQEQAKAVGW